MGSRLSGWARRHRLPRPLGARGSRAARGMAHTSRSLRAPSKPKGAPPKRCALPVNPLSSRADQTVGAARTRRRREGLALHARHLIRLDAVVVDTVDPALRNRISGLVHVVLSTVEDRLAGYASVVLTTRAILRSKIKAPSPPEFGASDPEAYAPRASPGVVLRTAEPILHMGTDIKRGPKE